MCLRAFYNERATRSLESAQDKYSTQQARAQTFVDNVNSARQKQETRARLQYSIECVGEQTMAATLYNPYSTGYGTNPYGYNSYRTYGTYGYNSPSLSILDSDGCVERKMAGIQTSPYDYYPSYYYTPNYYYVPQDQVTINVDTHVDVTVVTNDY